MSAVFENLKSTLDSQGAEAALAQLADQLLERGSYHELFEARKMQTRLELGLPLAHADTDSLSPEQQSKLEDGLLQACREVGERLLKAGKIHEGWMYFRPLGDRAAAAELMQEIEIDEDNLDEFVEVALNEGVDPARGFAAILDHYGTCNAITTYETVVSGQDMPARMAAAGQLVRHCHDDLLATLRSEVAREEGSEPPEQSLAELIGIRDWIFGENTYHIDTTHLASTVRFARILEDKEELRLALDLTAYGRNLDEHFQYHGEEPFEDVYPSHALYFQALLGENEEEAISFFREKATAVDVQMHGTLAIEVYVALLARLGRFEEATQAWIELTPAQSQPLGVAPSLFELAEKSGSYQPLLDYFQKREDLLGYATGLLQAKVSDSA